MDKLLVVSSELGGLNSNNIHQRKIDEKLIEARLVGNWNIAYVSTIAFVNNTNSNVCIVTTILLKKQ